MNPQLTHMLADVLGPGSGGVQGIDADLIAGWCAHFGGIVTRLAPSPVRKVDAPKGPTGARSWQ